MSPSQPQMKLEDIPLHSLYQLLHPITLPAASTRFNNWARTYFCTPSAIFEPESEAQCKLILELARREGRTVRAIGVGHSPSDLACTTGYMVRLTKMNRVIQVSTGIVSPAFFSPSAPTSIPTLSGLFDSFSAVLNHLLLSTIHTTPDFDC